MNKVNYVIAVDFDEEDYPENTVLLGWNCHDDWYDTSFCLNDIIEDGKIHDVESISYWVSTHTGIYVGEKIEDIKSYCEDANREWINATVLKVEIVDGDIKLTPQSI